MSEIKVKEKGFRKLLVWRRAHALVLVVYRILAAFPKHEVYGLTSQLRRASVSVPANVSEGHALGSDAQFLRHLRIAQGSLAEVEYYLVLARDLEYLAARNYNEAESLRSEAGFLLHRLIISVEERCK